MAKCLFKKYLNKKIYNNYFLKSDDNGKHLFKALELYFKKICRNK